MEVIKKRAIVVYKSASLLLLGVYDGEEETLIYTHPLTNQNQENIEQCFVGWSEKRTEENEEWRKLINFVIADDMLLQKIFDDIKEIKY